MALTSEAQLARQEFDGHDETAIGEKGVRQRRRLMNEATVSLKDASRGGEYWSLNWCLKIDRNAIGLFSKVPVT